MYVFCMDSMPARRALDRGLLCAVHTNLLPSPAHAMETPACSWGKGSADRGEGVKAVIWALVTNFSAVGTDPLVPFAFDCQGLPVCRFPRTKDLGARGVSTMGLVGHQTTPPSSVYLVLLSTEQRSQQQRERILFSHRLGSAAGEVEFEFSETWRSPAIQHQGSTGFHSLQQLVLGHRTANTYCLIPLGLGKIIAVWNLWSFLLNLSGDMFDVGLTRVKTRRYVGKSKSVDLTVFFRGRKKVVVLCLLYESCADHDVPSLDDYLSQLTTQTNKKQGRDWMMCLATGGRVLVPFLLSPQIIKPKMAGTSHSLGFWTPTRQD